MSDIKPYTISVDESRIQDLKQRLSLASFPDELDAAGWDLGAPLGDIKRLAAYWQNGFDWKKAEAKLNELPQFVTNIQADGFESLAIHFLHVKSSKPGAIPLLFSHGWPGSFLEATKVLKPLTEGGDGQPAFHVVVPSLPNFGFSEGTKKRGFALEQYAETCNKLMLKLGYTEYVTQGGDWGWGITRMMSLLFPDNCKATHLNMDGGASPSFFKHPILALQHRLIPYNAREKHGVGRSEWFQKEGFGYNLLQGTKPQTLGYGLADSPVALLAWIYEKLHDWSDSYPWTDDEALTWISIYWFSTAGPAASLRIYYERTHTKGITSERLRQWIPKVKIGFSHFPNDILVLPSTFCQTLGNVVFEKDHSTGGHYAAYEKPDEIVADLRTMFGKGGGAYGVVKAAPSSRI